MGVCIVYGRHLGGIDCIAAAILDEKPQEISRPVKESNHNKEYEYHEYDGPAVAGRSDHLTYRGEARDRGCVRGQESPIVLYYGTQDLLRRFRLPIPYLY